MAIVEVCVSWLQCSEKNRERAIIALFLLPRFALAAFLFWVAASFRPRKRGPREGSCGRVGEGRSNCGGLTRKGQNKTTRNWKENTWVSADMSDDASAYTCYAPRRRRMSLLQSLRQQNRALADSGFDMHRQRTDSESTNRGEERVSKREVHFLPFTTAPLIWKQSGPRVSHLYFRPVQSAIPTVTSFLFSFCVFPPEDWTQLFMPPFGSFRFRPVPIPTGTKSKTIRWEIHFRYLLADSEGLTASYSDEKGDNGITNQE